MEEEHSRLERMSPAQALRDLLPNALVVLNTESARRQLQIWSQLVASTACYRLHFGRNVLELPELIDPLLEERQAGPVSPVSALSS